MGEQVLATVIRCDKPVTLCVVEPFNRTDCHIKRGFALANCLSSKLALSAEPAMQYAWSQTPVRVFGYLYWEVKWSKRTQAIVAM